MRLLLDTCVLSEVRTTDGSPAVKAFVDSIPAKALLISAITIGEVTKGVALLPDGRKKRSLADWLHVLSSQFEDRILPLDHEAAQIWGELSAAGQKKGIASPVADGLIAATALRHGLHVATRNTAHFSPPVTERAIDAYIEQARTAQLDPHETLTAREREVLQLAAEGKTGAEIAARLHISPRTVENHRANLMRKLGLKNQSELVRYTVRRGLIPLEE